MKPTDQPQVSIIIPTYNGAARLPAVLRALADQDAPDGAFEVVIVDNASTDDTAATAFRDPAWLELQNRGFPCAVVREDQQGQQFARLRGLHEARAPLVCFLDDDNVPLPDYVRHGIAAMADDRVGLLVSRVVAQWAAPPPRAIARRSWLLAITDNLGDAPIDFGAKASLIPSVGAGMWVRREIFLAAVPWQNPNLFLPGRTGSALNCGEDTEIGLFIGRAGYRRIYVPQLRLGHLIPASRLRPAYFCRLIEGVVRSELTVRVRYESYPYNLAARLWAAARLLGATVAAPVVALVRPDGLREALFILASRWAQLKGPYAQFRRAQGSAP